ncbi:hypothetical protein DNA98_12945 [Meiothermus sp. Pnk-1]|nr:hypothetical protein DNA98_12945 [Meiothermus sp. Pnk-1]
MLRGWVRDLVQRDDSRLEEALQKAHRALLDCYAWKEGRWVGIVERYNPQGRAEKAALAAALYGGSIIYSEFTRLIGQGLRPPMIRDMFALALGEARALEGK